METGTNTAAKTVWDYMKLGHRLAKCDAIFTLCSIDERVAEYAANLFLNGYGEWLLFSGGVAHTEDLLVTHWQGSEAEHFAKLAVMLGVPKHKIIIENKATNTGENIKFTYNLLQKRELRLGSFLLVQKPYMERRTFATFKKQWPEKTTSIAVTSPPIDYQDYFNEQNPKDTVINIMVGDLQRLKEYPKLGAIGKKVLVFNQ